MDLRHLELVAFKHAMASKLQGKCEGGRVLAKNDK